jgi:hypothetical protein
MNELQTFLSSMNGRQLRAYVKKGLKQLGLELPAGYKNDWFRRPLSRLDLVAASIWSHSRFSDSDAGRQSREILEASFSPDPNVKFEILEKLQGEIDAERKRAMAPTIDG